MIWNATQGVSWASPEGSHFRLSHASQHSSGSEMLLYCTPYWHNSTSYSLWVGSLHWPTWFGTSMPSCGSLAMGKKFSLEVTLVKLKRAAHEPALPSDAPSALPAAWRQ